MLPKSNKHSEYEVNKMKKQAVLRGLLGFPLGIAMGYIITIFLSLGWGNGYYSSCIPELIETMGNEINAVILQAVLCGLLGTAFAACSVIWQIDSWSIAKQTGIYFLVTAIVMMPIAYFTNWMEHTVIGFISYFVIFIAVFVVVWVVQYLIWKNKVKKMNGKLDKDQSTK